MKYSEKIEQIILLPKLDTNKSLHILRDIEKHMYKHVLITVSDNEFLKRVKKNPKRPNFGQIWTKMVYFLQK